MAADDVTRDENLTIKQQREARRAEKVAALKAKQAKEKRNRMLGLVGSIVAGAAVIGVLIAVVVTSATPPPPTSQNLTAAERAELEIEGLETFEVESTHVQSAVEYEMTPPAGGPHNPTWLNCGIYEEAVPNEYAVHSLEHGAVWVTYDPEQVEGAELEALRDLMPSNYIILSPFEGLSSPVAASAWGASIALDGVDDERLVDFIVKYRLDPNAPEPGALCSQALDGPGKIA